MNQVLVAFFAFNEGGKIRRTIERFRSLDGYDLLVMDDGSTDGSIESIDVPGVAVLRNDGKRGAGYSVRRRCICGWHRCRDSRQHPHGLVEVDGQPGCGLLVPPKPARQWVVSAPQQIEVRPPQIPMKPSGSRLVTNSSRP